MRSVSRHYYTLFALSLALLIHTRSFADEPLYVISNSSITLSPSDINEIFSGEKQLVGSVKIAPSDNKSIQNIFLSKALGITVTKYNSGWDKRAFRDGMTKPESLSSDPLVIEFVKLNRGGVGYIASQPPSGVNLIKKY
ncbi:MAG: phosphate ABC transporter substrate-binding protein [Bdellovibrionota bacterium]